MRAEPGGVGTKPWEGMRCCWPEPCRTLTAGKVELAKRVLAQVLAELTEQVAQASPSSARACGPEPQPVHA